MNGQIPEPDWKRWRRLSAVALERYCAKTLQGVAKFAEGSDSAHLRYRELWQFLRQHDRKIADVFDDQRRSNALIQIGVALRERIITPEECAIFSEETRHKIEVLVGVRDA